MVTIIIGLKSANHANKSTVQGINSRFQLADRKFNQDLENLESY